MNPQNSQQALQQLQTYQQQIKQPQDIMAAQEQKLGIPSAQQQVTGLRQAITNTTNLLNKIPGSVYGRTGGSLVTSGQANRQIQGETAPVAGQLQSQGQQYEQASGDLTSLLGRAQTSAQMEQAGQQSQLGFLSDFYKTLLGKEQEEASLAEQQRQFNEAQKAAAKAAGGGNINLGDPNQVTGSGLPAGMTERRDALGKMTGFNFVAGNKPVSAATFAQANKVPLGDLLYKMGQAGDKLAQQAYNWFKYNANNNPEALKRTPAYKNTFSALTWGT